ncbi:Ig-like domain-containing protein [Runella salmonicolor]|uniref:Ig-like domain-containing protein n=1 Tax=Runella salmonicolor TaxID=2950278 RepID=A0ABT1FXN4_9BACT|nr:Ig-like domain-containing protein [Runella salmonicolor]MCP1386532.1 Ig-like domain-containing protein [Runella salmonicolor]
MKKILRFSFLTWAVLLGAVTFIKAQISANTVKYKITYDATNASYTAWVVPDYSVPNVAPNNFNTGTTEKGSTAQFTIVVPKNFVITQITDIKGTWAKPSDSGFTKFGPGNAGQTWTGLDTTLNYYVVGKTPAETDYGTFTAGTPVALFSFKGNGCFGPVKPLPPGDPFISAADATYSLNVANSFYSRSGQPSGGNIVPLEQFVAILGPVASCASPIIYAYDDNNITNKGVAVAGNVLLNDNTGTGTGPLVVSTTPVQQPSVGTLSLNADGTYLYTPTATFVGTAIFKYRVCDSGSPAVCDTAQVSIIVRDPVATNNPPIALGDIAVTKFELPVSGNVLTNDIDPDPGQTLTATKLTDPTNGSVSFNADGTYTYTPFPGFFGNDKFTYQACDNGNPQLCTAATVDLEVLGRDASNSPPLANDDAFIRTPTGTAAGNVLINDKDPEGDQITVNTTPISGPSNGTVTLNADGTFLYTPDAGYTGFDQFIYEVCDNANPKGCSQATVYIITGLTVPGNADLKITKTLVGSKTRALNDVVSYQIVVKNQGPDPATNVVVKDSVGVGLQLTGGTPTKGTFTTPLWTIPVLASGDSALLTVTAKVIAEGISFNYAIVKSLDQTDANKANNEDQTCVTVPYKLCSGNKLEASVPTTYTNVVWFKGATQVGTGNTILLSETGSYTFTATNVACPISGCCPLIIEAGDNCCPVNFCVPVIVTKIRK